jgi:hypothetical protein
LIRSGVGFKIATLSQRLDGLHVGTMSICGHSRYANGIMLRSIWASGAKPANRRLNLVDFSMDDRRPPFLSSRVLGAKLIESRAPTGHERRAFDGWAKEWASTHGRNGNSIW